MHAYTVDKRTVPMNGHPMKLLILRPTTAARPPVYAAPARQTDYRNLPPAFTFVGDREPFYCETVDYVNHLRAAGVPAALEVYPTGFHAFDMLLPFRRISRQAIAAFEEQYRYAAAHYTAPQPDRTHSVQPE